MIRAIDRLMHRIALATALLGGGVLIALVVLTVISVTGRSLVFAGLAPVPGDFELVEAGTAFAVFAFLPWCHLTRGHATVEIFTLRLPGQATWVLQVVADLLMLAVAALFLWRHWIGMLDTRRYGETTFILQFPLWWAYAAASLGAGVFLIVSVWCLIRDFADPDSARNGLNQT
ncbi:TRAP transporter small permease [Oricola sp.]|uniref:TRAP transporter small permease n=1 Tax=Oricola sp. TaxID=1979950 RepID=UPI003BAB6188